MRPCVEAASDWMKCHTGNWVTKPQGTICACWCLLCHLPPIIKVYFQSGFPDTPLGKHRIRETFRHQGNTFQGPWIEIEKRSWCYCFPCIYSVCKWGHANRGHLIGQNALQETSQESPPSKVCLEDLLEYLSCLSSVVGVAFLTFFLAKRNIEEFPIWKDRHFILSWVESEGHWQKCFPFLYPVFSREF